MNTRLDLRAWERIPTRFAVTASIIMMLAGCRQVGSTLQDGWSALSRRPGQTASVASNKTGQKLNNKQKADIQMALARSLEREGHADRAKKIYAQVIRKDASRADAYHRLAIIHDKNGESDKAIRNYRAALKRDPDNAQLHADLGYSHYLRQEWKPAEASLRKAIQLDGESARAHNNLGLLLARTGRDSQAIAEFTRAGCTEAEARSNLGFTQMLANNWKGARGQFEMSLAADPSSRNSREGLNAARSLLARKEQATSISISPVAGNRTKMALAGYVEPQGQPLPRAVVKPGGLPSHPKPTGRRPNRVPTAPRPVPLSSSPWPAMPAEAAALSVRPQLFPLERNLACRARLIACRVSPVSIRTPVLSFDKALAVCNSVHDGQSHRSSGAMPTRLRGHESPGEATFAEHAHASVGMAPINQPVTNYCFRLAGFVATDR